ncbi:zinc finger BED domain-containing protein 4, partial [Tachysurus ichikawai]
MEFICLDEEPLSVVEDKGFRRLLSCLDPRYDPPGRKYVTDVCLPTLYQTVNTNIDRLQKDSVYISFTSDIWNADACPMSLLSLTAHFIDSNFERHNLVLLYTVRISQELTQQISASTASAADVIPCIRALARLLENTVESDHGVKTSKTVLLEAVRRRFADIDTQKLYAIATMLDPRYKNRYFPEDLKPTVRDLFRDVVTAHCHTEMPSTSSVEVPGSSRSTDKSPPACSLQAMFAELVEEDTGQTDEEITILLQINQYLAEAVMPRSGPPLAYWQANKGRFPALAQAARAYLCSPCTSVDSEQLFSTAANVIDDKRNRLTSKNAEMLIVIGETCLL